MSFEELTTTSPLLFFIIISIAYIILVMELWNLFKKGVKKIFKFKKKKKESYISYNKIPPRRRLQLPLIK